MKVWIFAIALMLAACGGAPTSQTTKSPIGSPTSQSSTSPTASPPATGPLIILAGAVAGDTARYSVSLVGPDGKIKATTTAATGGAETVPFPGTALQAACCSHDAWLAAFNDSPPIDLHENACCAVDLPFISASASRVYFPDGLTAVRFLASDGSTGIATHLPNVKGRARAIFSVSPDDTRIAVSVFDWSSAPIRLRIYVEDLAGGGHHVQIFSSTTRYEWPVGWHAGDLILGVDPVFGGAPNPSAATAYHLVNPNTGARFATIGSASCPVVGPLTPAGTACAGLCGSAACVKAVGWTGIAVPFYTYRTQSSGGDPAALSPDGGAVAIREGGPPLGDGVAKKDGTWIPVSELVWAPFWIDSQRVLVFAGVGTNNSFVGTFDINSRSVVPMPGLDNVGNGDQLEGLIPGGF